MPPIYARSVEEAHLYLDLRGWPREERRHALFQEGNKLISSYSAPGFEPLDFDIPVPEAADRFGGNQPSPIIGPSEFLAYADALASSVPSKPAAVKPTDWSAMAARLETAAEAIKEVLKFIPGHLDDVPEEAFQSAFDREFRAQETGRFHRERLRVVEQHYRTAAERYRES